MMEYPISIVWCEKDKDYIATVPQLEGLSAFGDTPEEAIQELQIAYELYVESCSERGIKLPAPENVISFSGQTRLRMPKSLHAKLTQEAEREGVSLNTHIVSLLSERSAVHEIFKEIKSTVDKLAIPAISISSEATFSLSPDTSVPITLLSASAQNNSVFGGFGQC